MENKLYECLTKDEKILWQGKTAFKAMGETHKNVYAAKVVVVMFAVISFLMYYLIGIGNGEFIFKPAILVLIAVPVGVVLSTDWIDTRKMRDALYVVTDRRLITLFGSTVHSVEFSQIQEYKFAEDADGQISLLIGHDAISGGPRSYRANAVLGTRMNEAADICERFVFYAIADAEPVKKLMEQYVK